MNLVCSHFVLIIKIEIILSVDRSYAQSPCNKQPKPIDLPV